MIVRDTDVRFSIDPVSGEITNNSEKDTITQGSHNSEVFTFEMPRDIGHDMMNCNLIEVHYLNIKAKDKTERSEGIYKVNDLQVCPEDDKKVILSWTIDGSATVHHGTLSFSIHFKCISDDGKCLYRWPTKTFSKIGITSCVDTTDAVIEDNQDIIAEWEARISALEQNGVGMINVKGFGAIGDGVTDDTDAIRNARNAAVSSNKALYFPVGTYMIHGSIELWNGCEIYGEGSKSIIKKIPAITQAVRKPASGFTIEQTTFTVSDGKMYKLGYDCCVTLNWSNYSNGFYGKIDSIDGDNITISPYPNINPTSMTEKEIKKYLYGFTDYPDRVIFSSSFPVFGTYKFIPTTLTDNSIHDVYIHDLTIDGNRQYDTYDEPCPYSLSAINLSELTYEDSSDNYRKIANPHENIRIENLNIYNSPSDGISIQSAKNVYITNCITENCGFNGVHLGVGTDIASVVGCKLNADYCGYFDCADVGSVSLTGNHFEKCLYGVGGLDQYTYGLVITGNTFRDCSVGICAGFIPLPEHMSYLNNKSSFLYGHMSIASSGVTISNNAFYGSTETSGSGSTATIARAGVGISAIGGDAFVISGNTFRNLNTAFEIYCSRYFKIANNYIRECNTALSMAVEVATNTQAALDKMNLTHTLNSSFTGNTVQASATGASANITIQRAKNMLVTGNIVIGTGANIATGDNVENVTIENNITSAS